MVGRSALQWKSLPGFRIPLTPSPKPRHPKSLRPAPHGPRLNLVPQRPNRLRQLLQTEFESRFHRPERRIRHGCNLAVT